VSAWWRANRWYLVALAVILPAAVVVSMIPRWFPYVARQPVPETVPRGETVRYSGADIELIGLEVLPGEDWGAPPGADVVVAALDIDVVEPVTSACRVEIVSDEAGFERRWQDSSYSSDYEIPDDATTLCSFSEPGRYELQMTFLVPEGQVAEPVVQVRSEAALPRVLRLS
jgi:hypothetical protein